jgi:osmotically-inducible protein OsmY
VAISKGRSCKSCSVPARRQSSIERVALKPTLNTTDIRIKIEDALKRDAQIEAKDITVETSGALVTLRGRVHSWREHDDAEHAAFSAPGVGSVSNLLTVSY